MLVDDGIIFLKMWINVTKEEQLSRFKRRQADPYKHWKIGDEDWRNRKRWSYHIVAAEDMFEKTSTDIAPWHVIPGNYKWYARIKSLQILNEAVAKALGKKKKTG